MKKLSLRPFHGEIWFFDDLDEMRKAYKRSLKAPYPYTDDPKGGRYILLEAHDDDLSKRIWLVFAANHHCMAHEFSHVLLRTFKAIGHDPTDGDGEAYCYMLSQLMIEAM